MGYCLCLFITEFIGRRVLSYSCKDSTDYLLAGRRIGVLMTAGTLAATEIGGGSTVGVAAKAYGSWGLSAGWYVVSAGDWGYSRCFHRTAFTSCYGNNSCQRSSVVASVALVISLHRFSLMLATITLAGVQITATATIISVLTGLSTELAIPHLRCGSRNLHHVRWHVERNDDGRYPFLRSRWGLLPRCAVRIAQCGRLGIGSGKITT